LAYNFVFVQKIVHP